MSAIRSVANGPAGRRPKETTRLVIAIALTVSLSALALGPSRDAQASAGKTRAATTFVSKRYGYSIVLPGGSARWYARLAVRDWKSGVIGGVDSPEFDTFTDLRSSRHYLLASVPSTLSLSDWTYFAKSARASVCGGPQSLPNSTLGGAQARVFTWTCSDGYRVIGATALHARRGYFMLVISPISLSRASDLGAFQAVRRSFRFVSA